MALAAVGISSGLELVVDFHISEAELAGKLDRDTGQFLTARDGEEIAAIDDAVLLLAASPCATTIAAAARAPRDPRDRSRRPLPRRALPLPAHGRATSLPRW